MPMKCTQAELSELRAALADEGKLEVLTAQAEHLLGMSPSERREIAAVVEQRGEMVRLVHGMDAAAKYHDWSAAMFREVLDQIEAARPSSGGAR
ncbi:hypothetical protein [Mesorhizobium sp.]|uniref:hypothetical protein n=1 Tax=Mesorhizobium sp. TaxID=1871066 RepID=UPI000FE74C78|nr:hypothetical protein [Mesorhizobium sp.]RWQ54332.1 MAG: hypothetical protein EOS84_13575 [Mesorhizobium sp.]